MATTTLEWMLDPDTLSQVERDPYGNVRLAELELSRLLFHCLG
jgi:hypothetical protein